MTWQEFWAVSYLISPLLVGLTVHGFSIKFGWFTALTTPIDGGRTLGGKRVFGDNKTYRGIFAVGLGVALGFAIQALLLHRFEAFRQLELIEYSGASIGLGFLIGVGAMLSELVNSFCKRRIDIAPGETTSGFLSVFFYVFDQIDFLIGTWLVLAFVVSVSLQRIVFSAVFLFMSHQLISILGFWLGMRKTAR